MEMGIDFWAKHVSALAADGIAVKAYARQYGVSAHGLYYWRKKLNRQTVVTPVRPASKFVALKVNAVTNLVDTPVISRVPQLAIEHGCTLIFGDGMRLEMSTLPAPEWLVAVTKSGGR